MDLIAIRAATLIRAATVRERSFVSGEDMKKIDLLWLLALPIYQVIGTARHELSHAAAAVLEGAHVAEVRVLPSIDPVTGFLWGYVRWGGGHPTWVTTPAPYFCDLLVFAVFVPLCVLIPRMPRWLWLNCFVIGVASPLLDAVYNYQKVFTRRYGDVNELMTVFPEVAVHATFLGLIALFCLGSWAAIRAFRRAHT